MSVSLVKWLLNQSICGGVFKECCHLVSAHAFSAWRIWSSVLQLPASTSVYSSWSLLHLYLL